MNGVRMQDRTVEIAPNVFKGTAVRKLRSPVVINLEHLHEASAEIRYNFRGRDVREYDKLYTKPIVLTKNMTGSDNTVLKAKVFRKNGYRSRRLTIEIKIV